MATSFKTPGVYIQEISKFPPSVAEVATAIPAFIGYTEFATNDIPGDLLNIPFRISSLVDYEQYFGADPDYSELTLVVDTNNNPYPNNTTVHNSKYTMYTSMRLFFDNGGGACYIVSVGSYTDIDGITHDAIAGGIDALTTYNEPTIILFPDAVSLEAAELGALQQHTLLQCDTIGNRFGLFDLKRIPDLKGSDLDGNENLFRQGGSCETFRNAVGMNFVKYGAAYHPYLNTIYQHRFPFKYINDNIRVIGSGAQKSFKDFFSLTDLAPDGQTIISKLLDYESLVGFVSTTPGGSTAGDNDNLYNGLYGSAGFYLNYTLFPGANSDAIFNALLNAYNGASPAEVELEDIFKYLYDVISQIDGLSFSYPPSGPAYTQKINNTSFLNSTRSYMRGTVAAILQHLIDVEYSNTVWPSPPIAGWTSQVNTYYSAELSTIGLSSPPPSTEDLADAIADLKNIHNQLKTAIQNIINLGLGYETSIEQAIITLIPNYNSILNILSAKVNRVPPSGAMAGIFAVTDRDRGVWKAPANVSVASISSVDTVIDDATQENMNVDTVAGKSINAIRPFFGKGIIVWGSRTLAGNDNEWRYVPVRRFFSFVEESCKRSTSWAVFEPNDATLWMNVRSEIENFLYTQWRNGALAGAKPDDAYYVRCGIGLTMTAQDILNGYLNVEVGMAAVRPAEFIILKFSHKLQVS